MTTAVHLLSAGAAKGVVGALRAEMERDGGFTLHATFGAVGAMRERLDAGAPCDVVLLTRALIDALAREGRADADTVCDVGWVHTGVARRVALPGDSVADAAALRALLLPAREIYLPDPQRATAGIHAMKVLRALDLPGLDARLRAHPNGAEAMAALARSTDAEAVGITQVSEILYTPGVQLLGRLPAPHGLATLYSAARSRTAAQPQAALRLLQHLCGPARAEVRRSGGFETAADNDGSVRA